MKCIDHRDADHSVMLFACPNFARNACVDDDSKSEAL